MYLLKIYKVVPLQYFFPILIYTASVPPLTEKVLPTISLLIAVVPRLHHYNFRVGRLHRHLRSDSDYCSNEASQCLEQKFPSLCLYRRSLSTRKFTLTTWWYGGCPLLVLTCHISVALECGAHEHCAAGLACVEGRCGDPCARGGPCAPGQHCAVVDHQPVCSKGMRMRTF